MTCGDDDGEEFGVEKPCGDEGALHDAWRHVVTMMVKICGEKRGDEFLQFFFEAYCLFSPHEFRFQFPPHAQTLCEPVFHKQHSKR